MQSETRSLYFVNSFYLTHIVGHSVCAIACAFLFLMCPLRGSINYDGFSINVVADCLFSLLRNDTRKPADHFSLVARCLGLTNWVLVRLMI